MQIRVALLPLLAGEVSETVCVVVDVLRATTVIATLFARGCPRVYVAASHAAARDFARAKGYVLCGETNGFKVEPVGLIEFRVIRQLWLGGGYGVTFMRAVDVTNSAFEPTAATACTASGNNLTTEACQLRMAGRARPTAAGHYTAQTQDFGVTLTLKF